jgi:hypothetical protein
MEDNEDASTRVPLLTDPGLPTRLARSAREDAQTTLADALHRPAALEARTSPLSRWITPGPDVAMHTAG